MTGSEALLPRIRQSECNLRAQDAVLFPLWFPQQQSWAEEHRKSDSSIYNYPLAIRIRGPLEAGALEWSVREILLRHQVLRSVFRIVDGELVQIFTEPEPPAIALLNLSSFDPDVRESQARRLALADALEPFDLAHGPLLRISLIRVAADDHVLVLNTHHLVWDDWSTGIFCGELSLLYRAFTTGQSSALPTLSFGYADFVRWQNDRLKGVELSQRLSFWKDTLRGGNDFHHLSTDHPRPACRTYRGACQATTLDQEVVSSLHLLSRRERVTLFMTLLAAFQCLLHRYSGETDIAVGSCAANRLLAEVEGLIGRFGNDLILRTDLSGSPSFRELLARVRNTALAAYSYQDLPFGQLMKEFQPRSCRDGLFQVMFILQDAPKEQLQLPGLSVSPFPLDPGTAKYDLNVWLRIHEGLEVSLEYNTDLFEAGTMRQILSDYKVVLETMIKDPEAQASDTRLPKKRMATASTVIPGDLHPSDEVQQQHSYREKPIESRLTEIWETVLDKRPIGVNDNFFELGGDSLRAARLFARIQQHFQSSIPLGTLFQAPTVGALAKIISGSSSKGKSCVVTIQDGRSRPPLFCIHGQSGSVLMYRALAEHMGSDQPVYGVQPQTIDGQVPSIISIEEIASHYVAEIERVQGEGPYFLAGYCMGGTIAFEMAQQLLRRGRRVNLVVLLDTYNWAQMRPSWPEETYFRLQSCWFSLRRFLLLPSKHKLTFLRRGLKELWKPRPDSQEFSESSSRAALRYAPKVYPGRILHVQPTSQYSRYRKPQLSLSSLAGNGIEEFGLRGYPGEILEQPLVSDLAAKLRSCIDEGIVYPEL